MELDNAKALDGFLASVERRSFRKAEIATGNAEEALDIVQDAMFKLVQKYGDRGPQDWGPLFHRILQSRINDWYRRRGVRNRVKGWLKFDDEQAEVDAIQTAPDPASRTPEQLVGNDQAVVKLQSALAELPGRQQQAVMLRIWDGLDVKQTARAMGCSEGSVKTHYSRGVHTLREQLGEHWP